MKWVALYSRSGGVLREVVDNLGRSPDLTFTTHDTQHDDIMWRLITLQRSVVTLMGYLRIIPADVCERHSIYNYHPGPVTRYPECKGKDPIERMVHGPIIWGGTLHRVIPEVDEGPIVHESRFMVTGVDDAYQHCNEDAIKSWTKLLKEELK